MYKISFFLATLNKGGLERVTSILANHFSKEYRVTIFIFKTEKVEYEIEENVKVVSFKKYYNKNKIKLIKKIRDVLKNETDLAISLGDNINILTILSSVYTKTPIIISERNNPKKAKRPMFLKFLYKLLYRKADAIVFQTKDVMEMFGKKTRKKGIIIENPVISNLPEATRKEDRIVTIGRLVDQKNQIILVKAFHKVLMKYPNYKLEIYGKGEKKDELEDYIERFKLTNNIYLKGVKDDIHDYIKDSKLFILTSKYEGLSNALIESYSMGIPCIGSDIIGVNNIIKHNVTGLLFEENNLEDLTSKIVFALENYTEMIQMSRNAIYDSQRFSQTTIINQWEKLVKSIIDNESNSKEEII